MSQALKNQIRSILVAPRTIAQEYSAFDTIIDFFAQSVTSGIPAWTAGATFNTTTNAFTTHPDTNGALRFWKSKTDGNTGNTPPTDPNVTFNPYWEEVSPATGSAIKEWAPGIYGAGLIIVNYDDGTVDGFYKLTEATRPFNSTNFLTERTAGKWKILGDGGGGGGVTDHGALTGLADNDHPQYQLISEKGAANGYASLDAGGKVPSGQLPSFVDDVLEYATLASFPTVGETGKIYIATDSNLSYRWSGSVYVLISSSPATASPTVAGIARLYNDLNNSNTDGAVTQAAIRAAINSLFIQQSPATGGATITIDCANTREVLALLGTLSLNKVIALSNTTSTSVISILVNITGTVTLTLPSTFRTETSEFRWNNTTRALTLTGTTATPFELGAIWDGTFWRLKVTQDYYTS